MAMTIHERFGRKQEQLETEQEAHLETIGLLGKIVRGEIPLYQVVVGENSWRIVPPPVKVNPGAASIEIEKPAEASEHPRPEPTE